MDESKVKRMNVLIEKKLYHNGKWQLLLYKSYIVHWSEMYLVHVDWREANLVKARKVCMCNTCAMLVKKKYYNLFYRTYDFIPHKIFAAVSFKKRKKVTYLGFSVFLFALVFLFLLMSSENEVLRCLSKCDKTAITWRSIVENFAYDGASFKKESFFFWYVDVKADGLITRNSHTNASWSNKEKFNAPLTKYAIV